MRKRFTPLHRILMLVTVTLLLMITALAFLMYFPRSPITSPPATPFQHTHSVATGSGYRWVGDFRGVGEAVAYRVGPGRDAGDQLLYISYKYYGSTFDLVSVNPNMGDFRIHTSPLRSEWGANAIVAGPDGKIYLGTMPNAHIVKYDPQTDSMTDLGRPSLTEQLIWDATLGADHKIYFVTYPHAKLLQFDPATQQSKDLGRMDPQQQYARYIVASSDGFLYIAIGSAQTTVVAYNIATGEHRNILPYNQPGFASVFLGQDGHIYAQMPDGTAYQLSGWAVTPIDASVLPLPQPAATLPNGNIIHVVGNTLTTYGPDGQKIADRTFAYKGREMRVFRIAAGPDGDLYGSTILPAYLLRVDITSSPVAAARVETISLLPYAEVYSFLNDNTNLYMAGYGYTYPLAIYTPQQPFHPENPMDVQSYSYVDWRPEAMIQGPGHQLFIGAIAGYGRLGGTLAIWDTSTDTVEALDQVAADEAPISLTFAAGKVIGGTSIYGGEGSVPTQTSARLFAWDPLTHRTLFETIPVPGATTVSNLITAPNGLVYGIAGRTLFTFNPRSQHVVIVGTMPIPATASLYNADLLSNTAIGSDGNIWGLSSAGVYKINTKTNSVRLIPAPVPITGGYAFIKDKTHGDRLYFISGSLIYVYFLPHRS